MTHWLLIGGPGHGRALHIKAGNRVLFHAEREGKDYIYTGHVFVYGGKGYQLGLLHGPGPSSPHTKREIEALIEAAKLQSISTCEGGR